MAKEEELKRVDLKVNVSCCDGCRRKVMKAMSLKGVLRTEIHPSLDRVTVVGNVDTKVLVKKLAKVGKIAEVEVVGAASVEQQKKRDGDSGKSRDGGDTLAPAPAGEKSKRKDDGKSNTGDKPDVAAAAASYKKENCHKCAHQQSAGGHDSADHDKVLSSKATVAGDDKSPFEEEGHGFTVAKSSPPDHAATTQLHQFQYHRAEPPTMAVPVQHLPYYAAANVTAPSYYGPASLTSPPYYGGGYYAMPPPPPVPTMPMPWRPPQQQVSRFDVDYFNEDNTVGCSVM